MDNQRVERPYDFASYQPKYLHVAFSKQARKYMNQLESDIAELVAVLKEVHEQNESTLSNLHAVTRRHIVALIARHTKE